MLLNICFPNLLYIWIPIAGLESNLNKYITLLKYKLKILLSIFSTVSLLSKPVIKDFLSYDITPMTFPIVMKVTHHKKAPIATNKRYVLNFICEIPEK